MDEDLRNALRWVLLTDEVSWRGELSTALARVTGGADGLEEVKQFLELKLETADAHFHERMQKMIEEIGRRMDALHQKDDGVGSLLDEYLRIAGEILHLEERLQPLVRHRQELERSIAEKMAPDSVREAAGFRFQKVSEREGLEVVDVLLLPLELTVPSPDHAAIDAWFEKQGTAPTRTRQTTLGGTLLVEQLLRWGRDPGCVLRGRSVRGPAMWGRPRRHGPLARGDTR
jgi:hypothetical protein